jgi:hypothetical protein
MKSVLTAILLFPLQFIIVTAQNEDSANFVPDRPGMATPPNILDFRRFEVEDGFQYEWFHENTIRYNNYLFSSLLLRYGLSKIAEVRIQTDFAYDTKKDIASTSKIYGMDPLTIGSKIKILEQRKVVPNISFMFNLTLPFLGKNEFRPKSLAPSFFLLLSNTISEKLNVCYNYGVIWDGNSSIPTQFYALCLSLNLNHSLSTFIEGYGYSYQHSTSDLYIDAGFAYLITDHVQIDVSASGYLNSPSNYYMVNAGIAWLFVRKRKE